MSPDLEKELIKHPSKFYKNLYYFECSDGWVDLLRTLADQIRVYQNSGRLKKLPKATQVKEKFGRLRVYSSFTDPKIDDLIAETEKSSWSVCEHCGTLGSLRSIGGYLSTLCDDHYNQSLLLVRRQ